MQKRLVIKHKSVCSIHSEGKHQQEIRVWSRGRFTEGPCKTSSCLKNLNTLKVFSKTLLQEREVKDMVNCCKLLGVRSLLPGVRSQFSWKLSPKQMLDPKAQLLPSEIQVLTKRRESLRGWVNQPRSKHSFGTQPSSSLHCPAPAEEGDLSWRCPQAQVPRPCPATIIEGTRHQNPDHPHTFHLN